MGDPLRIWLSSSREPDSGVRSSEVGTRRIARKDRGRLDVTEASLLVLEESSFVATPAQGRGHVPGLTEVELVAVRRVEVLVHARGCQVRGRHEDPVRRHPPGIELIEGRHRLAVGVPRRFRRQRCPADRVLAVAP